MTTGQFAALIRAYTPAIGMTMLRKKRRDYVERGIFTRSEEDPYVSTCFVDDKQIGATMQRLKQTGAAVSFLCRLVIRTRNGACESEGASHGACL
jgi:hypothetical protein